jgi:hypothetical protein
MPITDQIKPTTIDILAKEDSRSIYVLNAANNIPNMRDGVTIFNVSINNDERRTIRVPNTWIPVDIGRQIPKRYIIDSPDFMDATMRGILVLVDTKSAQALFAEDSEAAAEQDRVFQDLMGNGKLSMDALNPTNFGADEIEGAIDADLNVQMAEAVGREDITEGELYSIVRRLGDARQLKRKDFDYILGNSHWEKVRGYATDQIARLPKGTDLNRRSPRMG